MRTLALAVIVALLVPAQADAGFFSRLFNRGGCASGNCAPQRASKAKALAPAYRTECSNGVCRRVLVK